MYKETLFYTSSEQIFPWSIKLVKLFNRSSRYLYESDLFDTHLVFSPSSRNILYITIFCIALFLFISYYTVTKVTAQLSEMLF